ncbi:MAG: anaerobic ribonucleoside-triphosphate reductase activating protein, partial [Urechidicola sp.]|nr:anaerobic ribonucleoside-triphosphate reductase activating protein [Urechidicola sp.]
MYYYNFQIVLQEVPGEISLCFSISGCSLHCVGCHSPFLWKEGSGKLLTEDNYTKILDQYNGLASCVLFMGGEWDETELISLLKTAKNKKYKTCLYTGEETVSQDIISELTWIKTGKWVQTLGGLDSKITNQKFTE